MRSLGCHFSLVFRSARGWQVSVYGQSRSWRAVFIRCIQEHLDFLGFTEQVEMYQVNRDYGAVYYGSEFRPRTIVLSEALGNLGTIATLAVYACPESFRRL